MAETFKKLYQNQVHDSTGTLYTVPGATQTIIKHMRAVNTSGSPVTLTLWHDGTTDAFQILPAVTIAVGGWAEFDGNILAEASDTISGLASAESSITLSIYGLEIS